jgi:hypothetical protein
VAVTGLASTCAIALAAETATEQQLQTLRDILARPEFQVAQGRGILDVALDPVRRLIRALLSHVIRFIASLFDVEAGPSGMVGPLIAIGVTIVAALVVLRLSRRMLAAEAALDETTAVGPPRADQELARSSALAQAGDWRGAVHHRYLAVLRRLDERGQLPFEGSLTNRELLPHAASAQLQQALSPLVAEFDQLWYGQSGCSAEEYARFASLADRAWQAAG